MNKSIRWVQNYLLYSLPFVVGCMVWGTFQNERDIVKIDSFFVRATWELASWNLILWFAVLVIFLTMLVVSPSVRDKTLKRLANLKERDEREQFITGKASRASYIATLSLMILLLFFSLFSLSIYHVPEERAVNGKTGTVAIDMHFSLLDKPRPEINPENKIIFDTQSLPLSKPAILLGLILWQLIVFNTVARREHLRDFAE